MIHQRRGGGNRQKLPHGTGAGSRPAGRPWPDQPANRRATRHQRTHCRESRLQHPRQVRLSLTSTVRRKRLCHEHCIGGKLTTTTLSAAMGWRRPEGRAFTHSSYIHHAPRRPRRCKGQASRDHPTRRRLSRPSGRPSPPLCDLPAAAAQRPLRSTGTPSSAPASARPARRAPAPCRTPPAGGCRSRPRRP